MRPFQSLGLVERRVIMTYSFVPEFFSMFIKMVFTLTTDCGYQGNNGSGIGLYLPGDG